MDAPGGPAHYGFDAWALCAEFVEKILGEAQASAVREDPGRPPPDIDRAVIWGAGDGAPSDEAAIGRVVRAAWEAAREISASPPEPIVRFAPRLHAPPPSVGSGDDDTSADHAPVHSTPAIAAPMVLVAGAAAAVEPVAVAKPVPVAGPVPVAEPVVPRAKPVAVAEPVATPVRPDAPVATPLAEPAPTPVAEPMTKPVAEIAPVVTPVGPDAPVAAPEYESVGPLATAAVPVVEPVALTGEPQVVPETSRRGTRTAFGWVTFFTWMRNIGAIVLLFVVWQLWGTSIAQHQAQSQLQAQFEASVRAHHTPKSSKPTLVPASAFVPAGGDGSVVAQLQVPSIGLDQYVVEGTNSTDLSKGPGHYAGTAMPGQAGNVAIAGHRTTHGAPFNRLGQLVVGDKIIVTTTSGQSWTYVVSATPVAVSPHDTSVLNYFGDNRITLTTCTPEFSATQRLIVVGALKAAPGVGAVHDEHLAYHVASSDTASWDWGLLPAVGLEVSLLVLLGLGYRRFRAWFGAIGMWLILVPLWAAGLVLLFTTLTTFLPSSY